MKLPKNKNLKQIARNLRNNATLGEVLVWKMLKTGRAAGFDFDRQRIIGNYIVDFFCPRLGLVIEIDGSSHDNKVEYDAARDEYLRAIGLAVLHIDDRDVRLAPDTVANAIETVIANAQQISGVVLK